MSSAKKRRDLNRAIEEHKTVKLSAQFATSKHTMLNIAESVLAKENEALHTQIAEQAASIRSLEDSLHHIVRECKASSPQTTRIRRIEARADAALNGRDVSFLAVKDRRINQVAYINQLAIQNRRKEETIAAQAALIEKLRTALKGCKKEKINFPDDEQLYTLTHNHELVEEALSIPTDSKQVLADWLDKVLGEPSSFVDKDTLIHKANGEFAVMGDPLLKKPEIK